ncbi:hypothetical protein B0H14DRAFT_3885048 [Mycena olivaceomarginata]|nr:hypothetical protein B0H14DRAFT_3885048 [Mycena olivaceomarginata]
MRGTSTKIVVASVYERLTSPGISRPPAILTFLCVSSTSGARAHVLLDRLRKTLSHAFVELPTEDVACSVLRSKHPRPRLRPPPAFCHSHTLLASKPYFKATLTAAAPAGNSTTALLTANTEMQRTSSLPDPTPRLLAQFGYKTRLTINLRGLLRVSWLCSSPPGPWFPTAPSSQLADLGCLMCTPDAYFVKAPGLPFYALMSLLAKFPKYRDNVLGRGPARPAQLRAHELGDADSALVQQIVSTAHGCHGPSPSLANDYFWGVPDADDLCRLSESNPPTPSSSDKRADAAEDEFHAHYEQVAPYVPHRAVNNNCSALSRQSPLRGGSIGPH